MLKLVVFIALIGITLYYVKIYMGGCVCDSKTRLEGKTVVITGANSGIGLETVKIMLNRGATVVATARDKAKCKSTIEHVKENEGDAALSRLKCVQLDLGVRESIESCTKEILSITDRIHILINNAGVMAIPDYTKTKFGFEMQFGVNHLGHFLFTHFLTPRLIESQPARIVVLASIAHRNSNGLGNFSALNDPEVYNAWSSYHDSKAANILHAQELSHRLKSKGVTAVSLHPGVIATELSRNLIPFLHKLAGYAQYVVLKTPWEGAQTTICCALEDSIIQNSGAYYSDCEPLSPSNIDKNDERGPKLWKFSEDFWGIKSL